MNIAIEMAGNKYMYMYLSNAYLLASNRSTQALTHDSTEVLEWLPTSGAREALVTAPLFRAHPTTSLSACTLPQPPGCCDKVTCEGGEGGGWCVVGERGGWRQLCLRWWERMVESVYWTYSMASIRLEQTTYNTRSITCQIHVYTLYMYMYIHVRICIHVHVYVAHVHANRVPY